MPTSTKCKRQIDITLCNDLLIAEIDCVHFSSVLVSLYKIVKPATCVSELAEFYRDSCRRHNAHPIESIMKHLDTLDLKSNTRRPVLNLREQNLTAESCEALEEVLKRVSHIIIIVILFIPFAYHHFCSLSLAHETSLSLVETPHEIIEIIVFK